MMLISEGGTPAFLKMAKYNICLQNHTLLSRRRKQVNPPVGAVGILCQWKICPYEIHAARGSPPSEVKVSTE